MAKIYECARCGVIAEADDQLCAPRRLENKGAYCSTTRDAGVTCRAMTEEPAWVCASCGREAKPADLLCEPLPTG